MKPQLTHLVKKLFIPILGRPKPFWGIKFCAQGKIMDCLNFYSLVKFTPL